MNLAPSVTFKAANNQMDSRKDLIVEDHTALNNLLDVEIANR